jgi:hypothetical protein
VQDIRRKPGGLMCPHLFGESELPGTLSRKLIPLPGRVRMAAEMATCLLCPAGLRGLSIFGVWRVKPLWKVPRWIGVAVLGQHAARTPGLTVLAAQHLPPPDDTRRRRCASFHVSVSRATSMPRNGPCLTPCFLMPT